MLVNYQASHAHTDNRGVSFLSQRPLAIGPPRRDWYRALVQAKRALG